MAECYEKIKDAVNEFCFAKPVEGYEIAYLERGSKLLSLYKEAGEIIEEPSTVEAEKDLQEILQKVNVLTH